MWGDALYYTLVFSHKWHLEGAGYYILFFHILAINNHSEYLYGHQHAAIAPTGRTRRCVLRMASTESASNCNSNSANVPATTTSSCTPEITSAKAELFRLISGLEMGTKILDDTTAQSEVNTAIISLEELNPTTNPADHPLRAGRWKLLYTNSAIVLGRNRPGFARPDIGWQTLEMADGESQGTIRNEEESTFTFFFGTLKFQVRNQIVGKCRAIKGTRIRLKFEKFTIGNLLQVPFPGNVVGWQDQTFLDEQLRIARTHTGNVFVLERDTEQWNDSPSILLITWLDPVASAPKLCFIREMNRFDSNTVEWHVRMFGRVVWRNRRVCSVHNIKRWGGLNL